MLEKEENKKNKKKNKTKSAFFSIIVPCYNGGKFIEKCMLSILAQTYKNFEVLIIDDGSIDSSNEILKKFTSIDKRFKIIKHKKNQGLSSARNSGLIEASGQYIAFLDIDDWWPNDKLEIYNAHFEKGYDFLYSNFTKIKSNNKKKLIKVKKSVKFNTLIFSNQIPVSTGAYNQNKIGFMQFSYKSPSEDWLFWLDLIKKSKKSLGIQKNLMFYNVSNLSMSANKINMAKKAWSIFREFHKFGVIKSIYIFLIYCLIGIKRTYL